METGPAVTLIIVCVAIAVIAAFLITVVYQLGRIMSNLKIVLGVVAGVVEKTEVLDPVLGEIKADIAGGEAAIVGAVERLKSRTGYDETAPVEDPDRDREPAGIGTSSEVDPPSTVFRNY